MIFSNSIKVYGVLLALSTQTFADTVAIIGGISYTAPAPPYAALVTSSGELVPLPFPIGVASSGAINSVSMNSSSNSLVGGEDQSNAPFAALVSSTGEFTPLTFTGLVATHGFIQSVALNSSGNGIIGGRDSTGPGYAALVPPSGNPLMPLALPPLVAAGAYVNSVAINDAGTGLIGGNSTPAAFAAYVSPLGDVHSLSLPPSMEISGNILSVSLNSFGNGIIGGQDATGTQPAYAAFVSSSFNVTPINLTGNITTTGIITSVAINDAGNAIVGGQDRTGTQPAFAALVSSSAVMTTLNLTGDMALSGTINAVAINPSGNAIIGGQDLATGPAYAALVSPSGVLTPLPLTGGSIATAGFINTVAINSVGNGIIGGQDQGSGSGQIPYAALFTSLGEVIPLTFSGNMALNGLINSVALPLFNRVATSSLSGNNLIFANYINEFAPENGFYFIPATLDGTLNAALQSADPTRNAISIYTASNNLFDLTTSFATHIRNQQLEKLEATDELPSDELLTSLCLQKKEKRRCIENPSSIWVELIGASARQKAQHQTVGFNPTTYGAVVAYDHMVARGLRVGGGASYLFTHIHEKQDQGDSNIRQEEAFIYSSWDNQKFYVDMLIMGGAVQIRQVRNITMTGFSFHASSDPKGWQFLPHVELGVKKSLFNVGNTAKFSLNPFVMVDWAKAWQESFKERGESPFNASQSSSQGSLLRSEAGLRFYQTLLFNSWNFIVQEKLSYVNVTPYHAGKVHAFLVGSPGSFTVETLSSKQDLGVAQFAMSFDPINSHYPKTSLFYQGEFSKQYQSNQVNIEFAWQF